MSGKEGTVLRILTLVMVLIWGGFIAALFWSQARDTHPSAPCLIQSVSDNEPCAVMFGTETVKVPCD